MIHEIPETAITSPVSFLLLNGYCKAKHKKTWELEHNTSGETGFLTSSPLHHWYAEGSSDKNSSSNIFIYMIRITWKYYT